MGEGAFITSRDIFENQIWKNVIKFRMFLYLFGNAVHSTEGVKYGNVLVRRGQILKSYRKLSDELEYIENNAVKRYSISSIKRTLDELVVEDRITTLGTELGTLITIVNYEEYQRLDNYKKKGHETPLGTALEHLRNNNKNVKNDKDKNISTFERFWTAYPKKRSKGQAEKAWAKIKPDEQLHEAILMALERAKTSVDWTKENGKYIPYPATWLNAKGWEDEYGTHGGNSGNSETDWDNYDVNKDCGYWSDGGKPPDDDRGP